MPHTNDLRFRSSPNPIPPGMGTGGAGAVTHPTVSDVLRRYSDEVAPARTRSPAPERAAAVEEVALSNDASLFLSKTGNLVPRAGQDRPRDAVEMGDTLFRAAMRAEEGENIFDNAKIALEQKRLSLASLAAAFNLANAAMPAAGGFQNKDQALQVRGCVAPLLLDLADSLAPNKPAEAELQKQVVAQYMKLLESEKHGLNRNFMIFDLDNRKDRLPAEFRGVADTLMNEVAPVRPFYDEWFANGNNTLRIDYHVGAGFWESEVDFWVQRGWERRDNGRGSITLSKKHEVNGVETNVEMLMHDGGDDLFRKMNDKNVHVVVYSGHANYGRKVMGRLPHGTPQVGNKVFFGLQCGGKGVHNGVLEKYPDLQVVQSKNSSYPNEDRWTLLNAIDGFVARKSWTDISTTNRRNNSDNYYFPTDTMVNKRAEDRDGDGIIDAWDRVVSYNRFRPQAAVAEELTARDPGRGAHELDGRRLHGALQRFLRMAGYNQWTEHLQDQRVLTNGFYDGKAQDPALRVRETVDPDGERITEVKLNKHYAHASEETLGALLCYELCRDESKRRGLNDGDAKASGLLMVAKCLNVDNGGLDNEIWRALLAFEKLPAAITFQDALASAKMDEHMGAGTRRTVTAFQEKLRARNVQL